MWNGRCQHQDQWRCSVFKTKSCLNCFIRSPLTGWEVFSGTESSPPPRCPGSAASIQTTSINLQAFIQEWVDSNTWPGQRRRVHSVCFKYLNIMCSVQLDWYKTLFSDHQKETVTSLSDHNPLHCIYLDYYIKYYIIRWDLVEFHGWKKPVLTQFVWTKHPRILLCNTFYGSITTSNYFHLCFRNNLQKRPKISCWRMQQTFLKVHEKFIFP